jgi:hypothetical protein
MRRIAYVLLASTVLVLTPLGGGRAQDVPADITVLSVLTMAKEEAEKEPNETSRGTLRGKVALSMMRAGQATAFGSYVMDARTAHLEREMVEAQQDEAKTFNLEILAKAKQAFLAGNVEQAKEILGQCRMRVWPPPRCSHGEWPSSRSVHDLLFLGWEVEEGRFDGAFERLKTIEWFPELRATAMVVIGPHVAAGNREKLVEVRRLAEAAGGRFDSCIMTPPPSRLLGEAGPVENAAALRKLACDGEAKAALDRALSQSDVRLRINALLIVAEGLAGVPGSSFERLTY